jgi:hypothetical protein
VRYADAYKHTHTYTHTRRNPDEARKVRREREDVAQATVSAKFSG